MTDEWWLGGADAQPPTPPVQVDLTAAEVYRIACALTVYAELVATEEPDASQEAEASAVAALRTKFAALPGGAP